ncbi:MAG: SEC-C domain-containing protein [Lachnospiraceae bacterium]|nr:SEC-C domain-containing protein [Lachnospiraceae bacterium]
MKILEQWRDMAYSTTANKGDLQRLWQKYFLKEKEMYQELLKNPDEEVKGTVKELADKFGIDIMTMTGFLDGIDESLVTPNNIEEMEEDTVVSLKFDKVKLYKNMVGAKADWLYELEEWNDIFTPEEKVQYYKEQKRSTTFVREGKKIGRNDPCPCGSGKKYKNCCGKNA